MSCFTRISMLLAILGAAAALASFEASAASPGTCNNYANRAVQQFSISQRFKKCRIGPDGRWHTNYKTHRDWCLGVTIEWVRSEQKVRDDHLYRCGGQIRFD